MKICLILFKGFVEFLKTMIYVIYSLSIKERGLKHCCSPFMLPPGSLQTEREQSSYLGTST